MSFSVRYVPAVLFAFFSLTVSLSAQSTTAQTTKINRGTISGRITIKEKGAPGVIVGARKGNRGGPFEMEPFAKSVTDHDGYYRITNLAAASYEVTPSAPAFVATGTGNIRSKSVIVGEDENVEGINFSLVRGGVITGRVTDADGRPVIQQQVQFYRIDAFDQAQQRPVFAQASVSTDDRGIYRIFGLIAGRYKVASGRGDDAYMSLPNQARESYKQVFHPDVTDQTRATVIEVNEGSEANNVDITLGRRMQTYSVSGRVIDDKGGPVTGLRFGFQRGTGQRTEVVTNMAVSGSQGDFIVEGLIPGKYGVYLFPNQSSELRAEALNFDVVDQDVSGLTIRLAKGSTLSGVVILETEDKGALEKLKQLQLRGFVQWGGGFGQSALSSISPDGSFRLTGLPAGTINLMLGSMMGTVPNGFNLSRVERDGVVLPRGIEVKEGENVTGLRVFLAYGNATLRGVVKLENGTLPEGAQIVLRLTKSGENTSNIQPPRVDARGRFAMEGIPPGVYEVSAYVAGGPPITQWSTKREVTLQEGVPAEVVITIDMAPRPPKP